MLSISGVVLRSQSPSDHKNTPLFLVLHDLFFILALSTLQQHIHSLVMLYLPSSSPCYRWSFIGLYPRCFEISALSTAQSLPSPLPISSSPERSLAYPNYSLCLRRVLERCSRNRPLVDFNPNHKCVIAASPLYSPHPPPPSSPTRTCAAPFTQPPIHISNIRSQGSLLVTFNGRRFS